MSQIFDEKSEKELGPIVKKCLIDQSSIRLTLRYYSVLDKQVWGLKCSKFFDSSYLGSVLLIELLNALMFRYWNLWIKLFVPRTTCASAVSTYTSTQLTDINYKANRLDEP